MSIKSGSLQIEQKDVTSLYCPFPEDVEDLRRELANLQLELKIKNDQIRNQERTQLELTQSNIQLQSATKEYKQLLFYKSHQIQTYKSQQTTYKQSISGLEKYLQVLCEDISKSESKKKIFSDLNEMKTQLIELREAFMKSQEVNSYTQMQDQQFKDYLSFPESSALQSPPQSQKKEQKPSSLSQIPEVNNNQIFSGNNLGNAINSRKYLQIHQQNSNSKFEFEVTQGASQSVIPKSQLNFESVENLEERKENSKHSSPTTSDALEPPSSQTKISKTLSEGDPDYYKNFALLKWLGNSTAEFSKIKMVYYNNYRGVHARQKIKKGDTILFIPKEQMMTLEQSREATLCQTIEKMKLPLLSPKHTFLSIYILQEKKNLSSFWKPFLDLLPSEYTTFPILYSEDELSWLKGSPFLHQIKERRLCVSNDYSTITSKIPNFTKFCTLDEFAWARMMAASRIYGLYINKTRTDAFVPLADLFNHRRPAQANWGYCPDKGGFVMKASEDIKIGDQIYYSCGRKCNSRFLLNYGFVVQNNESNEITVSQNQNNDEEEGLSFKSFGMNNSYYFNQVKIDFDKKDETIGTKIRMVGKRKDEQLIYRMNMNYEEKCTMEFFAFLRFVLIRDLQVLDKFSEMVEGNQFDPNKTPPFSIDNEKSMWNEISKICIDILNQYPTTLDDDKVLLDKHKLSINQKNCVILRLGEKEILSYYLKMAQTMQLLFSMTKTEVKKHILQNQELTKYSSYVNGIVLPLLSKKDSEN